MRLNHVLFVVGRLKHGVTYRAAQAEMDTIAPRVGQQYPEVKDWGINLVTFTDTFVSSQLRTALLVLLGAVVFVLVIVSANVANLLLARALERQREMAVRAALGAGRARLLRQLLIESVLLSGIGGAAGIPVAAWAVSVLESTVPPNVLPVPDIGLDRTVVMFAFGVTLLTGIVFGLAPAWQAARTDLNRTLKAGGRSASGGARPLLRKGLACAELALATVLLVGATLLVRSLLELQRVPLGFDPDGVTAFQIALPPTRYDAAKRVAFHRELGTALQALPGVQSAGTSSGIPFGVGNYTTSPVSAPGSSVLPPGTSVPVDWRVVSPRFFETVRIPLLRGRTFAESDTATAPAVMIVSLATARRFWGDGILGQDRPTRRRQQGLHRHWRCWRRPQHDPQPRVSRPLLFERRSYVAADGHRRPDGGGRHSGDGGHSPEVREIDPELPLSNVRAMREWVATSAAQPRLNAMLLGIFAGVALLVAAIGTYGVLGVLGVATNQRTRVANGARRRSWRRPAACRSRRHGCWPRGHPHRRDCRDRIEPGVVGAGLWRLALRPVDLRRCLALARRRRAGVVRAAGDSRVASRSDGRVAPRVSAHSARSATIGLTRSA